VAKNRAAEYGIQNSKDKINATNYVSQNSLFAIFFDD
jgi:hypothetical protein